MAAALRDVEAATLALDGSPPVTANHPSDVPCPLPRRIAWVLSSLTPSAGSGLDAISKDVANLAGSIADARISAADMILVCNPRQAVQLKAVVGPKFDYLVLDTPMVPNQRVIGLAPASIASAYSGIPSVEKVPSAVIQFEDTNPQNIVDAEGNVGAPAQSTFQTDMIGIRIRCRAAWSVVAAGGVAYIDNVSW
jgi:hypothetical protein